MSENYFTPRERFDSAIIRVEDNQVQYSRQKVIQILSDDYMTTLTAISHYRGMPEHRLKRIARKQAKQWLDYATVSNMYGFELNKPVLIDEQ
tara:strand:+ start:228 stop:503 length:276 start_codon:yes stop_codon:yes gene_type:complete